MKIYLHIGIEKTGTTAIQSVLYHNRTLLQKQGVALSKSLNRRNNVLLAAYAMDHGASNSIHASKNASTPSERVEFEQKTAAAFLNEVKNLPANTHSLVLSNEHCHSNLKDSAELEKLRDLLFQASDDVTIVVYLRRQVEVCISLYSTLLKAGSAKRFDEHFSQLSLTHFYNYLALINLWADVFGEDHIDVRLFDKERFVDNDLIADFCSAVGIEGANSLERPDRTNESLLPDAQELLAAINQRNSDLSCETYSKHHALLKSYLITHHSGKGYLPSRTSAQSKQAIFDVSNAELKSIYFPERESLFSNSFLEFPE